MSAHSTPTFTPWCPHGYDCDQDCENCQRDRLWHRTLEDWGAVLPPRIMLDTEPEQLTP